MSVRRNLSLVSVLTFGPLAAGCFGSGNDSPGSSPDAAIAVDAGGTGAGGDAGANIADAASTSDGASAPADAADAGVPGDGGWGGPEAITVPGLGQGFDYYQGSYSLGWSFTANAAIQVTQLGFYDDQKNGLTQSHPVGIYDMQTKALLVQATVSPSDPLTGYFRYVALPQPLALTAGHNYVIMANVGSEKYLAFSSIDVTWTVAPAITYQASAVNYANPAATTLLFADTFTRSAGDFGPNFQFAGP
jgi:hypothetical protein